MKIINIFNPDHIQDIEHLPASYRTSTRAVVLDEHHHVALLYAEKLSYHALPGGGVDEGETVDQALVRECKEEIGCTVEIIKPLGKVIEIRSNPLRTGEVFGYLVKVIGEKGIPELMPDEIEEGFIVKWLPVDEVKKIFENELIQSQDAHKQIPARGLSFLKEAFPEYF